MSNYKIYDIRNFDFNEIKYTDPQKTRGNAYICNVEKEHDMVFQTGIVILKEIIIHNDKEYYIKVEIENADMGNFISELDEYSINYIFQNSKQWFGGNESLPLNQIRGFYKSNMTDNELILNIPLVKKKIEIKVFDDKKTQIPFENLAIGSKLVIVWRLNGIKFLKKDCTIDSDVVQILYLKSKQGSNKSNTKTLSNENTKNSELLKRIQFRDELKLKKEKATAAFAEAEQAKLHAEELKTIASQLALEVKNMEDEYFLEEADEYEESLDDTNI